MATQAAPALIKRKVIKRKVNVPTRGGVDEFNSGEIAWTGGNPYDNTVVGPAANGCYRPIEPDKARKVEDKCVQPLPEARRLKPISTKPGQKFVPLIQWMRDVATHLAINGMDGVFYTVDATTNTVVTLLEHWSKMTITEAIEHVRDTTWDAYDYDNLRLSGKFIRDSISDDLFEKIKFAVQSNDEGPILYVAIVQEMQQIGTVAARIIVDEIRKLHIYDIPGEDVKSLTNTLFEYCSRLEGVQAVPFDLAAVVTACFLKTASLPFNMEVANINKKAQVNGITWSEVLTLVGTEYQMLLGNGQWEAKMLPTETSQKALKAEIKNEVMQELRKVEPKPTNGGTTVKKDGGINPNVICKKCKEKGHIAKNCPKKPAQQGGREQSTSPYKVKPKDGEAQVKSINGAQCSWCDRCNRWTYGDKRHATAQHKTREELQNASSGGNPSGTQVGNLAAGSQSYLGGGLSRTNFLGAGHA